MRNPRSAADFSPCRPKPNPAFSDMGGPPAEGAMLALPLVVAVPEVALMPVTCVKRLPPAPKTPAAPLAAAARKSAWVRGRVGVLPRSRQEVRERLVLMEARKARPRRTLMQPTAKRKKAETRAKVPTWCERTAAPILLL